MSQDRNSGAYHWKDEWASWEDREWKYAKMMSNFTLLPEQEMVWCLGNCWKVLNSGLDSYVARNVVWC